MANDTVKQVEALTSAVKNLRKEITGINTELNKTYGLFGKTMKGAKQSLSSNLGKAASRPGTGADDATFSNEVQNGQRTTNMMPWSQTRTGGAVVAGTQMALGVAAAAYSMAPDLGIAVSNA